MMMTDRVRVWMFGAALWFAAAPVPVRALETAEAHRQGTDQGKGSIARLVAGTAALAASIAGVITVTAAYL